MNQDIKWIIKLRTYLRLRIINLIRVFFYRLGLKFRLHPVQYIKSTISSKSFFRASERQGKTPQEINDWDNSIHFFGWYSKPNLDGPPDWFQNPFSQNQINNTQKNWWNIPDFGNDDIKCVWELSRFNWVIAFSTQIANGNKLSILKLNHWLENWVQANPPYKGPNWKCAQECSIRLINLVITSWILGQDYNPENGLKEIIKSHLKRIEKTLSYGIAQQNNHAISEAAALFIGGSFLSNFDKRAKYWTYKGRKLLENHISKLIASDGTFSQYSLNYHRFMLDICSFIEAWRNHRGLEPFSEKFIKKLKVATECLWTFIIDQNGKVPNIGANDGSQILQLSRTNYSDYRPSVQLAASLFMNVDAFGDGLWNEPLYWLNIKKGNYKKKIGSITFDKGGYHVLRNQKSVAVLNYPQFQFRPSQSDALHVDLWVNGKNLLKDGGTFSYNSTLTNWFMSTAAHNTIEFDKRNQMPHISRFLFGDWLKSNQIKSIKKNDNYLSVSASYSDNFNNSHQRKIILNENELICLDKISGNFKEACLRWRLINGDWQINEQTYCYKNYSISIKINDMPTIPNMGSTFESLHYQQKNKDPLIFVKVKKPSILITKFTF